MNQIVVRQAEIAKDGVGFVNIEILASFRRMKVHPDPP